MRVDVNKRRDLHSAKVAKFQNMSKRGNLSVISRRLEQQDYGTEQINSFRAPSVLWCLLHLRVQYRLLQEHLQRQRVDPHGLAMLSGNRRHAFVLAPITLHAQGECATE